MTPELSSASVVVPKLLIVAPAALRTLPNELTPWSAVVPPAVVLRFAVVVSPLIVPPLGLTVIAPVVVRPPLPFWTVPPLSVTLLIVCAKPPRSSAPPVLTVVALPALKAPAVPPLSVVRLLTVVVPE